MINIVSTEIMEAVRPVYAIIEAIRVCLETPPELAADIMNRGIDGGRRLMLRGLDELVSTQTGMPCIWRMNLFRRSL